MITTTNVMVSPSLPSFPDYTFDGGDVHCLTRPIVYGWRRSGEYLYIGKGKHGIERPFSFDHHVIRTTDKVLDTDKIDVWVRSSECDALAFERLLIERYKPRYNGLRSEASSLPEEGEINMLLHKRRFDLLKHRKCVECGKWFWTNLPHQDLCANGICINK